MTLIERLTALVQAIKADFSALSDRVTTLESQGGGGGGSVYAAAQIRNNGNAGAANINTSAWTEIPIGDGTPHEDLMGAGFSRSGNRIVCGFSGTVRAYANVAQDSSAQRTNVGVRIALNGTGIGPEGLSGYARRSSNHNEGSSDVISLATVANGDEVSVIGIQRGASGTVRMMDGACALIVERMS